MSRTDYKNFKTLFLKSNKIFINKDKQLFELEVSERTLCGALKSHLEELIKGSIYDKYYCDIEFNRNYNGKLKTIIRHGEESFISPINITVDLIVHSRGEKIEQDNLIAIEMKKSTRSEKEKHKDRNRLIALTKDTFSDLWSFDGKVLPEHVCRYIIGIYYEINLLRRVIILEFYYKGIHQVSEDMIIY